jgi:hypothetical protein
MSCATPGGDLSLDELPFLVDDIARRYLKALAMAIASTSDRADERASAIARGGLPGVRRILADIIGEVEAVERRIDAMTPEAAGDHRRAIAKTALGLTQLSAAIQAIRSVDVDDGRILAILGDPLAKYSPRLALTLCADGSTAAAAIEILRIAAINGGVSLSTDPGGSRVQ